MMRLCCIALTLPWFVPTARGQFDFGGNDCGGNGNFQQTIDLNDAVLVGNIPYGLEGLQIQLTSSFDVDIQLKSGSTSVIAWQGGVIDQDSVVTKTWKSDSITYSGWYSGNEYVKFNDRTSNSYRLYAYGYQSGFAQVTYSWTGKSGCTSGTVPSGTGRFSQPIVRDTTVSVGVLPAGIKDVYVRLDSSADIDLQLYDGSVAVIDWKEGILAESHFQRVTYSGMIIEYSGYKGEQRADAFGQEYVFIRGTLPRTLSLRVLGYASGQADVNYSWGYYESAKGLSGARLFSSLHEIIDGHNQLSYDQCWDALKRTDQDNNNSDNVILFYSRRSESKNDQDRGTNDSDAWNREHIFAKSHGNFGTGRGA